MRHRPRPVLLRGAEEERGFSRGPLLVLLALLTLMAPTTGPAEATITAGTGTVPGELDASFGGDGWVVQEEEEDWGWKSTAIIQPDGKVVVTGSLRDQFEVWRFQGNGDLDPSLGGSGRVAVDFPGGKGGGVAAALQPDGRIVVAGYAGLSMAVARFLPDGTLDPGFGEGDGTAMIRLPRKRAQAEAIELLPDGRILLGASVARARVDKWGFEREIGFALTMLTPVGAPDPGFGSGGTVRAPKFFGDLTVDDHGIVVMGLDRKRPSRLAIARYTFGGARDETFAPKGLRERSLGKRVEIYDGEIAIDAMGRIVLSTTGESRRCWFGYGALVRLNADGGWDTTFSADGVALRGCRAWPELVIQQDGKIVVAGEVFAGAGSGEYTPVLARVGPDGALDETFGSKGLVTSPPDDDFFYWSASADVDLQQDGKIVLLVGAIWEYSFAVGRFLAA